MKTMILLIFLSVEKDFARRDSKLLSGPRKLISFKYPSDPNSVKDLWTGTDNAVNLLYEA